MAQLLNFTDGDRLYITYLEAMSQATRGYSVKSGCDITPISGMDIALASGYVTLKGKDVAISSDTITIEASETDKDRVDVIVYNTDLDTVTTLKGTTWVTQDTISYPMAVSIQDTQIPIALIYVRENTTEILSTDITNINLKNFYNDRFESGTILPYETDTQDLGYGSKKWRYIFSKGILTQQIGLDDTNITTTTTNDIVFNDTTIDYGASDEIVLDSNVNQKVIENGTTTIYATLDSVSATGGDVVLSKTYTFDYCGLAYLEYYIVAKDSAVSVKIYNSDDELLNQASFNLENSTAQTGLLYHGKIGEGYYVVLSLSNEPFDHDPYAVAGLKGYRIL
jgi:hypothetical protein